MSTYSPITIREAVAAKLANSGDQVATSVIDSLANAELNKRETLLLTGLATLDKAEKELKKIRPDQRSLDADGKLTAETFSTSKYDELKKAREGIDRITNAINKALNDRDFSKLTELAGKSDAKPADSV